MSTAAKTQALPALPAAKQPVFFFQLGRGGGASAPAVFLAEVSGWSGGELVALVNKLYRFHAEREWIEPGAQLALYALVRHDTKSTKTIEVGSAAGLVGDATKTSAMIAAALRAHQNTASTMFTALPPAGEPAGALSGSFGVGHFAPFFP